MPKTTVAPEVGTPTATWIPSRKWIARTIIAAGGLATMYFSTGAWDTEESIALVTLVVGAATSYLLPNDEAK